jgi:capsular polysaccharide transport system permease protein
MKSALDRAQSSRTHDGAPRRLGRLLYWAMLYLPTLAAIAYYGLLATPRYASEAQFIVRTASKPAGGVGLGAVLQMTGLSRSNDDIFTVQSYLTSRDAVRELEGRLPLRAWYGTAKADMVARYPSLFYRQTAEDLFRYFNTMTTTTFSSTTSITKLTVQAFEPEQARQITEELLKLGEQVVNRMNERIQTDTVRVANEEVRRNEARMIQSQIELTQFRNRELMIDPARSSVIVSEVIARLMAEQVQTRAQLGEVSAAAPDSPQTVVLKRRLGALDAQIVTERQRISDTSDGLASKLALYERLVLDREFAKQGLAAASRALDVARLDARRQQLYLERVVEPTAVDDPKYPKSLRIIATIFTLNVLIIAIFWLVSSGLREHKPNV